MSLRLAILATLFTAGCVHRYVEPRIDEPHATVKVRVLHHVRSGPQLDLNGRIFPADDEFSIAVVDDGLRVVRVRLLPTTYRISSGFFHTVQQMQTVYVSESYACGTQTSGYGTHSYSSTRYCTRSVPRQQWVTVRISDGDCEAAVYQPTPIEGGVYLVQYDYFGPGVCSLTCLRQIDTGNGTFQFTPCGVAEPPALATAGGESASVLQVVPPDPAASAPPSAGRLASSVAPAPSAPVEIVPSASADEVPVQELGASDEASALAPPTQP